MTRMPTTRARDAACWRPRAESGFVLPTAIFLLVVLAALGSYMVSLSRASHISSALDMQGGRSYQAARAGIEWAAWQSIQNAAAYGCATAGTSSNVISFSADLASFTTTVACSSATYDEGGNTVRVYSITSTASSGEAASNDYVERMLTATLSRCTDPGGNPC